MYKKEEIFITKIKKEYKGSVTIEMSLLFPIVVFVIIVVMLMSFYVSDIVSIRAKIYEYCAMQEESDKTESEIKNELQKKLKDYTIIAEIKSVNVKRKNDKLEMSVKIEYDFGYFNMHNKDTISAVTYSENTRDYIIRQKAIIDAVKDIK